MYAGEYARAWARAGVGGAGADGRRDGGERAGDLVCGRAGMQGRWRGHRRGQCDKEKQICVHYRTDLCAIASSDEVQYKLKINISM